MTAKTSPTHAAESPKSAGARGRAPHDALEVCCAPTIERWKTCSRNSRKPAPPIGRKSWRPQICAALKVHTQIEEKVFYPAARGVLHSDDLLDEAVVEHGTAKSLIEQIESSSPGESMFDAKVMVLSEYIKHHVKEEETELFPPTEESGHRPRRTGRPAQRR